MFWTIFNLHRPPPTLFPVQQSNFWVILLHQQVQELQPNNYIENVTRDWDYIPEWSDNVHRSAIGHPSTHELEDSGLQTSPEKIHAPRSINRVSIS